MNLLPANQVFSVEQFPTLQKKVVRQVNREAASLLAIEALANQIMDLSSSNMSRGKAELIQQYAEAITYNLEHARDRLGRFAINLNDISLKEPQR